MSPLLVGRIFSGSSPSVDMAGDLELKKSLNAVFSRFGKIVEVLAFKTLKHKGQAWVVFDNPEPASNAISKMNGFPFYNKPMRIQFAKRKSDVIAKADGTFVPREKRKRQEEKVMFMSLCRLMVNGSRDLRKGHQREEYAAIQVRVSLFRLVCNEMV
ncbi:hypothetical protein Bca101_100747 [Brassica carinata]